MGVIHKKLKSKVLHTDRYSSVVHVDSNVNYVFAPKKKRKICVSLIVFLEGAEPEKPWKPPFPALCSVGNLTCNQLLKASEPSSNLFARIPLITNPKSHFKCNTLSSHDAVEVMLATDLVSQTKYDNTMSHPYDSCVIQQDCYQLSCSSHTCLYNHIKLIELVRACSKGSKWIQK